MLACFIYAKNSKKILKKSWQFAGNCNNTIFFKLCWMTYHMTLRLMSSLRLIDIFWKRVNENVAGLTIIHIFSNLNHNVLHRDDTAPNNVFFKNETNQSLILQKRLSSHTAEVVISLAIFTRLCGSENFSLQVAKWKWVKVRYGPLRVSPILKLSAKSCC